MATFNLKNFFKQNSPKFMQIIGDIGLLATFISGNILLFKQELINSGLTFCNSSIFDKINIWALAVGVTVKFISKFFGKKTLNLQTNDVQETSEN